MPTGVTKIDVCGRHPTDHARLGRELSSEPGRIDSAFVQLNDGALQLFEGNRKRQMTRREDSVLPTVARACAPQADSDPRALSSCEIVFPPLLARLDSPVR